MASLCYSECTKLAKGGEYMKKKAKKLQISIRKLEKIETTGKGWCSKE
ncbi:MAG: hypothetical protein HYV40_00530 [Candidatus Levybacteria bacterium]|nr:hypothetical protein [Candidatus Levybacteria bacterium]